MKKFIIDSNNIDKITNKFIKLLFSVIPEFLAKANIGKWNKYKEKESKLILEKNFKITEFVKKWIFFEYKIIIEAPINGIIVL